LDTPLTIQALRILVTQERLNIIFIIEAKNQKTKSASDKEEVGISA